MADICSKTDNNISNKISIVSRAAVYDDENRVIWMITNASACLISLDMQNNIISEVYPIPTTCKGEYAFLSLVMYEEKIYIAPYNAKEFVIFDIKNKIFEVIDVSDNTSLRTDNKRFCSIFQYMGNMYLVGANLHEVLKYDTKQKKFDCIYSDNDTGLFSLANSILDSGVLYIPMAEKNIIHAINLDNEKNSIISIGGKQNNEGITSLASINGILYAGTCEGHLIVAANKNISEVVISEGAYLYGLYVINERIVCFDLFKAKLLITEGNRTVEKDIKFIWDDVYENKPKCSLVEMVVRYDDKILFQSRISGNVYCYDIERDMISSLDFHTSEECENKLLDSFIMRKSVVDESRLFCLNDYLNHIWGKHE
ncbi:MAG: hypothetical protein SPE25_05045 [Lachnospiraceae bacterium]|nr:hypothetical protein [Lachnospiraceae bacterium]